jgi:hypothetical protein
MIYEAKQEPEDVITVTEFRTVTELLKERKLQLKAARLWRQPYESKRTEHAEYLSVKRGWFTRGLPDRRFYGLRRRDT